MDRTKAVDMVIEGLSEILDGSGSLTTELLLENTAGQGETMGTHSGNWRGFWMRSGTPGSAYASTPLTC